MKPKGLYTILVLMVCSVATGGSSVWAQSIGLSLSAHPNQEVVLLEVNGIRKDTLQKIRLDAQGNGRFNLKEIKRQAGIVGLVIQRSSPPDVTFDWIYSPAENPTIIGHEEYVHSQNAQILNSPENQSMDKWATQQYILKQKQGLGQELLRLYASTDAVAMVLQGEQTLLTKQLTALHDDIRRSPLFAATMMQFRLDAEQKFGTFWASDSSRKIAREYFRTLNFEKLYTTGQWHSTINVSSELYDKHSPLHQYFSSDIIYNLRRIQALPVYTALADAAISICEANSWTDSQVAIIHFLVTDNRLQNPTGKLAHIAAMQRTQAGNLAPDLLLTKTHSYTLSASESGDHTPKASVEILPADQLNSQGNTLLVFHESGCGHCEATLKELQQIYPRLKAKGWRVISLASDVDAGVFKQTADALPWEDKYCDLKGFVGQNFQNYAVIGTPTLYVIDSTGKIITKTALVKEAIEDKK